LDKIKDKLGADAPAEVSALLADATREATDILDTLSSANRESASRKTKIRELEQELEIEKDKTEKMTEKQKEYEQFKSKAEQYDQYLAKQNQEILSSWKAANEKLASIKETDKRYERVKPVLTKFKKAEEGKELSAADAKYNLDLYDIMVSTGVLSDEEKGNYPNYPQSKAQDGMTPQTTADAIIGLAKKPIK
jgi:DNA repair exonuclease SbcCD ATPase subunit